MNMTQNGSSPVTTTTTSTPPTTTAAAAAAVAAAEATETPPAPGQPGTSMGTPTMTRPEAALLGTPVRASMSHTPRATRGSRPTVAVKRGQPPRNSDGQIFCDHPDCRNSKPVFRRPCEWNKHMDKHDRPYKCLRPECEKMAGFTYSGGLLRHQREVHKMHTHRQPYLCSCPGCDRNTRGFTRWENLKEHMRRLHGAKYQDIHQFQPFLEGVQSGKGRDVAGGGGNARGALPALAPSPSSSPAPHHVPAANGGGDARPTETQVASTPLLESNISLVPGDVPLKDIINEARDHSPRQHQSRLHQQQQQQPDPSLYDELLRLRREIEEKDARLDKLERVVNELQREHPPPATAPEPSPASAPAQTQAPTPTPAPEDSTPNTTMTT